MCLIIFAHHASAQYPFVLAANRDEFYQRPSQQAALWSDSPNSQILAGKDLQAGGTWLGITRNGRFAAVTNIRDPALTEQKTKSRGELTLNYLSGSQSPKQYSESLIPNFDDYAGYNLLIGDRKVLYYVNNHEQKVSKLEPGVYGLSNGLLNSSWPKINKGRQTLQKILDSELEPSIDLLLNMMYDQTPAADADLPTTGLPQALERSLSSAFIHHPGRQYGTLCSTAIIVEHEGGLRFGEQNFDDSGLGTECHFFQLGE